LCVAEALGLIKIQQGMRPVVISSSVTPLVAESIKMTLANGGVERASQMHREIYKALQKHDPTTAGQKMALPGPEG
jgi:DNA-binding FadR family transcriptional regulator